MKFPARVILAASLFSATAALALPAHADSKSADEKFNSITVNSVQFKNSRFDPKLAQPFFDNALKMATDYGYTSKLSIDPKIAELVRVRVSQKNECGFCIILHAESARKLGINPSKIDNISSWSNSDLFSSEEKAVLAYADQLSDGKVANFQSVHDGLAKYYSAEQIATVAAVVINMDLWTRYKLAQGQTPYIK
jgi:AhpD family alkylhydroperoxidase